MSQLLRFYRGRSMGGTFRTGDYLVIDPVPFSAIRRGDVILFRQPMADGAYRDLVHRVAALLPDGAITWGDNNSRPDGFTVGPDAYIGLVARCQRRGKTGSVAGSGAGMRRARLLHLRRRLLGLLRFLAGPPYRLLRQSGLVGRVWKPSLHLVHFNSPDGPFVKVLVRGRTAAILWTDKGLCVYRKPYDLALSRRLGDLPHAALQDDERILEIPDLRP